MTIINQAVSVLERVLLIFILLNDFLKIYVL
jgi:hypothetical protein